MPVNGSEIAGATDAAGTLVLADYGSIWNFWVYDADSTAALTASSNTYDKVMVVGTRDGQGVIGRQAITLGTRTVTSDHEASITITGATVAGINTLST